MLAGIGAAGLVVGLQLAERNAPAEPSASTPPVVTVPVESRQLVDLRQLDCTASRADIAIAAAATYGGASPVVTAVRVPNGRDIRPGEAVVEVSGRPVIALPGPFPLYRDLRPGDKGVDVRALQEGLRDAGYGVGADGTFGPRTERAVRALYRHVGYPVATETAPPTVEPTDASATANDARATTVAPATRDAPAAGTRTSRVAATPAATLVVPKTELVMLDGLPARKTGGSTVGAVPGTRMFTVQSSRPTVSCTPPNSDGIAAGQTVNLDGLNGRAATATVASITPAAGATPAEDAAPAMPMDGPARQGGDSVALSMNEATLAALPDGSFSGQVVVAQTAGPVAVVPLAAVGGSATNPQVTVLKDGRNHQVDVTLGLDVDGSVEVRAVNGGDLRVGDDVVITG